MGYDFTSLTFDLETQLRGKICQGQGQRSVVLRMHIAMDCDLSYQDKVAKCNSFRVMRQFINIFTQKWPPGGHFGSDGTEITTVQFLIGKCVTVGGK